MVEFVLSSILNQSTPGDLIADGSDARDAVFRSELGACQLTGAYVCSGCLSDAYVSRGEKPEPRTGST
jgi:hypothetical protein